MVPGGVGGLCDVSDGGYQGPTSETRNTGTYRTSHEEGTRHSYTPLIRRQLE